MQQQFIQYKNYTLFQYARLQKKSNLLVFMPGLGDSFLNYQMFFELEALQEFDIVVPDLLGYGKTGGAPVYDYAAVSQCFLPAVSRHY